MPIIRDDFKKQNGIVSMESEYSACLYAEMKHNGNFFVSTEENLEDGWYFDKESCRDAIKFFNRLIEIMEDKGIGNN